ncbi:MAG TPA: hypothetical protein VMI56_24810 [Reyranella sp.]|nr:hypothetical protein [Reyranella sp.]
MQFGTARLDIRPTIRIALLAVLATASLARAVGMIAALRAGNEEPLLAFPMTVVFPAVLVILLAVMPPARSREGVLMRVGTMIQLLLIVMLPAFGLYLALGLPVVFLCVELFETRLPAAVRAPIVKLLVA